MSFVKYKNSNNASSLLIADITASQTTILITDWDQWLFPSSFPFLLTLEHLDASENVILREIVKVVSSNQNSFTVERSAWICVQDDTATNRVQDNTAHAFYSWDKISLYWTAEQVADIQNNLELKANQDSIANVYDNTATYSVGDVVVYQGDRYTCTTAVWTPEDFDSTKWTKVNVQYDLNDKQSQIDTINETISHLWWIRKVDVLVLGWWGWGWGWSWYWNWYSWWWGWAWQLKVIEWVALKNDVFSVVVWTWWTWWTWWASWCTITAWNNWNASKFWKIVAIGWGWGWAWCASTIWAWNWNNWWNWWGAWWNSATIWYWYSKPWASWFWWHIWWSATGCASDTSVIFWWGWGWVWWDWWNWPTTFNSPWKLLSWQVWGRWIATCFWWTLRCLWWWWWASWASAQSILLYFCGSMQYIDPNLNAIYNWICYWWGCNGNYNCCNWVANTWWGGWGGHWYAWNQAKWWAWWSWLVIVRYPTDCSYWIKTATGGTITTATIDWIEYKVHTFTSSWTFEITETA